MPRPPKGGRGGSNHWDSDCRIQFTRSALIRIRHHREVPGHVESGHKDRLDVVPISFVASECNPRVVVTFDVYFELGFRWSILPIRSILGH